MLGYYKDEENTNNTIIDGWLHTGDLGYFDKRGKLFVTGRKKNIIILKNGKNINPEEQEQLLDDSELIEESFVYGQPQPNGDYKICAKIVYSMKNELLKGKTEAEIYNLIKEEVKRINKTMPVYKYIKSITITQNKLIRTTTNKIKRYEEMKRL